MSILSRRQFLGVGVAGIWAAGRASAAGTETAFTFAAINDSHVKDLPSVEIVERAVAGINADGRVRFTVVLGDIATDGVREELGLAKEALGGLARPWFAVPGNHDVAPGDEDIYANYVDAFGPVHWVHEEQDWTCIGFDSCEGAKSFVTVAEAELDWLREQAASIPRDKPVALFCHHPLNPNTRNYRILNADAVLGIFREHALRVVAAGHWHGNQLETADSALFTTTACCASTRTNFDNTDARGYRLFHVNGGAVETEFVEVPLPFIAPA